MSEEAELERARAAYRARDASTATPYRWDNPGYVAYMQSVERAVLAALRDAAVPFVGARTLDVGCGSGYFLHRLKEYGAGECVGVDLLDERIAAARGRYPGLDFHVANAARLPFVDGSFDLVTQFTCLSSILDDDVRLAAAREMQRVGAGGWMLSLDVRSSARSRPARATPTVALDRDELQRLFGVPLLVRRAGLRFDVAQTVGQRSMLAAALAELPPLRGSLIGVWRAPGRGQLSDR